MQRQTAFYRAQSSADDSYTVDDVHAVPLSAHLRGPAAGTRLQQQLQQRGGGGISTGHILLAAQAAAAAREAREANQQQGGRRMSMDTIPESPGSYHTARDGSESPMQTADSGGTPMSVQSTGHFSDPSSAESASTTGATTTAECNPFQQAHAAAGFIYQPLPTQRPHQPAEHGLHGTALAPNSTPALMSDGKLTPTGPGVTASATFNSVRSHSDSFSSSFSAHTIEQATAAFGSHGAPGMPRPSEMVAGDVAGQGAFGGFAPISGPQCSPVGFKTNNRSLDSFMFMPGAHVRCFPMPPLSLPASLRLTTRASSEHAPRI